MTGHEVETQRDRSQSCYLRSRELDMIPFGFNVFKESDLNFIKLMMRYHRQRICSFPPLFLVQEIATVQIVNLYLWQTIFLCYIRASVHGRLFIIQLLLIQTVSFTLVTPHHSLPQQRERIKKKTDEFKAKYMLIIIKKVYSNHLNSFGLC